MSARGVSNRDNLPARPDYSDLDDTGARPSASALERHKILVAEARAQEPVKARVRWCLLHSRRPLTLCAHTKTLIKLVARWRCRHR